MGDASDGTDVSDCEEEGGKSKEKKAKKDKDSDSDSSSSKSDSDDSDSDDDDEDDDGETPAKAAKFAKSAGKGVQPKKKPKAKATPTSARPLLALDELPATVDHPCIMWDVERSFKAAISDKLASFVVKPPQGDSNVADILEAGLQQHEGKEAIKKLPYKKVCGEMKAAANVLEKWGSERIKGWDIESIDIAVEKEALDRDFLHYDKCLKSLQRYQETLAQENLDIKSDAQKEKHAKNELESKIYTHLRNQGLPAAIAKVCDVL